MNRRLMQQSYRTGPAGCLRVGGFSLVELLTVMFIISVLIGLLIPSLNAARNAAKRSATNSMFASLKVGLDMFRNDHERTFRRTNGYPPSFAHPPIPVGGGLPPVSFRPHLGEFPFVQGTPMVTGAHWLPAMLMGVDGQGFIDRKSVPRKNNLPSEPWMWYQPRPTGEPPLSRSPMYVDPSGGLRTISTQALPGVPDKSLFPDWAQMKDLPVIVDPFDQPVLYYVANANGRGTNMVDDERVMDNVYTGGPPIYFHQDNRPFTGVEAGSEESGSLNGWSFGSGAHAIARSGKEVTAPDIILEDNRDTFARFILDRKQFRTFQLAEDAPTATTPLTPVNRDSYLLISAGVDGRYGTIDDITNFPMTLE